MLVVVGVEWEARAIRRHLGRLGGPADTPGPELILRSVGLGAAALPRIESGLQALGADAVLVAGLAGGCAVPVEPGDLVLASAVGPTAAGDWLTPAPALLERARARATGAALAHRTGRLLTAAAVVATPAAKAECWRRHQALAVDMESVHVLAWAARAGLPALAVRAVADGPGETLPPALAQAVGGGGHLRPGVVLGWVARPALLGEAWRLWWRSRVALDRLTRFLAAFARAPIEP